MLKIYSDQVTKVKNTKSRQGIQSWFLMMYTTGRLAGREKGFSLPIISFSHSLHILTWIIDVVSILGTSLWSL